MFLRIGLFVLSMLVIQLYATPPKYTKEELREAVNLVKSQEITVAEGSRMFGIPESTLRCVFPCKYLNTIEL